MSFRILSIDGGGIREIVAARMLQAIEQQLNQPLRDYFDLITGTSTGAIIAAGLMIGRSAAQLVDLYLNKGQIIFPYRSWFNLQRLGLIVKYGLSAPKFADDGLIRVIQSEIGLDKLLADVSPDPHEATKLMITSYDTVRRLPIIFKSWRHEEWYASVPLWETCVCSASAPTYFPAHLLVANHQGNVAKFSMIDGGVGANNPVACAVAEAIRLLRSGTVPGERAETSLDRIVDEISVLSVGTGELGRSLPWQEVRGWGAIDWAPRIVDVIMDAPADIHRYIAEQIVTTAGTEQTQCYLRLQPELNQKFGAIDNASLNYLNQLLYETDAYLATQRKPIESFFS
ncbi:patatin-like phospholipase family protein [Oculatella sp. LEGE 06141]|uniref:patatin-like phospholipase family protein n=1 Tax=Oculatella sp. LEGE 06141 TaxID=1828648 RepID=UPI00187FF2A6|nr:patatin-like phospholipase family protein [Oculatella sp. LEGE 06141]MBE9182901.1 patatin-like phospholipase family protein [Oculatella sp. LEGE 06141]